jgi:microcystin-dependent protein
MEIHMEPFVSQIIYMPFTRQIDGFLPCRGDSLPIKGYEALYSLIGTTYGGDGSHFNIPDLRPWSDSGPDYGHRSRREWNPGELVAHIALVGVYPAFA